MNILVTGGCGFIGANFIQQRLRDSVSEDHIVNLDLLTYAGNPENLIEFHDSEDYQFVQGDIGDADFTAQVLKDHSIDIVINRHAFFIAEIR